MASGIGCDVICAGQVFTAEAPEGVGPDKYDETVGSMVAQLKQRQRHAVQPIGEVGAETGVPLPATTQWEIVEEAAELLKPAHEELIRQERKARSFTMTTPA